MDRDNEMRRKVAKDIIEVCGSVNKGGSIPDAECRDYAYKYKGNSCRYCITDQIFKYLHSQGIVPLIKD